MTYIKRTAIVADLKSNVDSSDQQTVRCVDRQQKEDASQYLGGDEHPISNTNSHPIPGFIGQSTLSLLFFFFFSLSGENQGFLRAFQCLFPVSRSRTRTVSRYRLWADFEGVLSACREACRLRTLDRIESSDGRPCLGTDLNVSEVVV